MSSQVPSSGEKQAQDDTRIQQQMGGGEEKLQDEVPAPQPPSESMNASLYVGDLALSVDEEKLKAKFSTVGNVQTTRVCRDAVTRQSLRYGYVNFQTHEDAKKALVDLNFDDLDGQPMRIMWCQQDSALRRSGKGNLFLKNLAEHVDSKAIYETFSMFGPILSCKVVLDGNGKSKGFGFIHFEKEQSAKEAIEKVDGMELDGKKIFVGEFVPNKKRSDMTTGNYTNVFVCSFDETVGEDKLRELFAKYGPIKSVFVSKSPNGPRGKAFGFVDFENHDDAVKAVAEMNGMEWQGSKLMVNRAMKKAEIEMRNRSNLYVQWIGDSITSDEELQKEFGLFGSITSAKIAQTLQVMRDEHGCSRQFGFVAYEHMDDARQALQAMNGKSINGRPILVAMAMPKLQRREELARQIAQNRFQTQRMQPLYSRGPVMQQQMVGFPQMRTQLPFYAAQPSFRGPFPAPYPPSANPQFVQRAMMYPQQNVPVSYGGGYPVYENRLPFAPRLPYHVSQQAYGGVPQQSFVRTQQQPGVHKTVPASQVDPNLSAQMDKLSLGNVNATQGTTVDDQKSSDQAQTDGGKEGREG